MFAFLCDWFQAVIGTAFTEIVFLCRGFFAEVVYSIRGLDVCVSVKPSKQPVGCLLCLPWKSFSLDSLDMFVARPSTGQWTTEIASSGHRPRFSPTLFMDSLAFFSADVFSLRSCTAHVDSIFVGP